MFLCLKVLRMIFIKSNIRSTKNLKNIKKKSLSLWSLLALDASDPVKEKVKFYNWDDSPYEDIRIRSALIKTNALCRVTKKPINFICPLSGIPTHHSKDAWEKDTNYHKNKTYKYLKEVNIFEHIFRSRSSFNEFVFPKEQLENHLVSFSNWDSFFYTRNFKPMEEDFSMALVTKMLTFPITIASLLHKMNPYMDAKKSPFTYEGLKSLAALRYTLYPPHLKTIGSVSYMLRPMRIYIVGAKIESLLPGFIWKQFAHLFPNTNFEIHFIDPEISYGKKSSILENATKLGSQHFLKKYDNQLHLHFHIDYFHNIYNSGIFFPFDPYLDVFFLFNPGFNSDSHLWNLSFPFFLETKCAVFVSGYHSDDIHSEFTWIKNNPLFAETDILMQIHGNLFKSTKLELVDTNPTETLQCNHSLFAFRGKRYPAIKF